MLPTGVINLHMIYPNCNLKENELAQISMTVMYKAIMDSLHSHCFLGDNVGDSDTWQPLLYLPWTLWALRKR